jgi:DNA-binding transcriptional regulator YiaG
MPEYAKFFGGLVEAIGTVAIVVAAASSMEEPETGLHVEAETVGDLIREARKTREMSTEDLARIVGITELELSWWEKPGERFWKPKFDQLITIKQALNKFL